MSTGRQIRSYDYVNRQYDLVRDILNQNALTVFQSATKAATARAESVAAELHVDFAGIGVKADIKIHVKGIEETASDGIVNASTRLLLEWEAANLPRLFPLMHGELSVYPLTGTETQLDFSGTYEPPLGAVGKTINAIAGHRIAEASVHSFVTDVAGYLRQTLAGK
jgi:ribosome-associated toxin RatA of RatAB toxin-antitoxin module